MARKRRRVKTVRNLNARLDVWRCRRLRMLRPHPRLDPAVSGMTWRRYPVPRRAPPDLRAGLACLTPAQAEPGNGYPCEVLNYAIDPLAGPPKEAVQGKSLLGGLGRLSLPVYHYSTMSPCLANYCYLYCKSSTPRPSWPRCVDAMCGGRS